MSTAETPASIVQVPDMSRMRAGDTLVLRFNPGTITARDAWQIHERMKVFAPDIRVLVVEADQMMAKRPWRRRRKVKP